ncbi:MAG TPA: hypothetical protein VJS92_17420 [Candidatus Polarisedimenticolaceae bacterium]|nr:hypothetical protein [Candidatus Polarisedimenticolaceae bacterium]
MNWDPKTISEHIDSLARLTGAPPSFVEQVRSLFTRKGIGLDTDGGPYLKALEEAFRREESIRVSAQRARQGLTRLHDNFHRIGRSYVQQLQQLRAVRDSLQQQQAQSRKLRVKLGDGATQVAIQGDHRAYVTPAQREDLPLVPGPEEPQ